MIKETVSVEIFGKKYPFRSEEPDKIRVYADYLNSLLAEISSKYGLVNYQDSLMMTSMLMAEKYFEILEQKKDLDSRIEELNESLSEALKEN